MRATRGSGHAWRAGCGETRTSGSERAMKKPAPATGQGASSLLYSTGPRHGPLTLPLREGEQNSRKRITASNCSRKGSSPRGEAAALPHCNRRTASCSRHRSRRSLAYDPWRTIRLCRQTAGSFRPICVSGRGPRQANEQGGCSPQHHEVGSSYRYFVMSLSSSSGPRDCREMGPVTCSMQ